MKKTVLLLYPKISSGPEENLYFPLSLLALSGPLMANGYKPVIIDSRVEENPAEKILELSDEAICLGITAMIGNQISDGLSVAKKVRGKCHELPIVWGGWGPTVLADMAVQNPMVDVVVRGQGEITFLEVLKHLATDRDLSGIDGISYRRGKHVFKKPDRAVADVNELPPLPYHLVPFDRYAVSHRLIALSPLHNCRQIDYITSRGCPFRCAYCSDFVVNKGKWYALEPERVISDLERFVAKFKVNAVHFHDNNFFSNPHRIEKICRGIIEKKLPIIWRAQVRADQLARFSDDYLAMLHQSGCRTLVVGMESGNPEILELINKKTRADDNVMSVRQAKKYGIALIANFMVGFPDEPQSNLPDTLNFIGRLFSLYREKFLPRLYFFFPIPGSPLYQTALGCGWQKIATFASWGREKEMMNYPRPWMSQERCSLIWKIVYAYGFYMQLKLLHARYGFLNRMLASVMIKSLCFRMKRGFFGFLWEIMLFRWLKVLQPAKATK